MPIPSRLAGLPESLEQIFRSGRVNAAEQRTIERHNAWREDRANRDMLMRQAQRERDAAHVAQQNAMSRFQAQLGPTMAMMGGIPGKTMIPSQVKNPLHAQEMEKWQAENERMTGPHPPGVRPNEMISQPRVMTPQDKYNAWRLYNRAHGTNMPGPGTLAKAMGAGGEDAQDPFVEARWDAAMGKDGLPFAAPQREAYRNIAQDAITGAMASAMEAPEDGIAGVFGELQQGNIDDARRMIMQDAWTVARKIAYDSKVMDAGTVFNQILDAMASGKINALQISQASDDPVLGDSGFWGWAQRDKRNLEAAPMTREQIRQEWENAYRNDRTSANAVNPIIRG